MLSSRSRRIPLIAALFSILFALTGCSTALAQNGGFGEGSGSVAIPQPEPSLETEMDASATFEVEMTPAVFAEGSEVDDIITTIAGDMFEGDDGEVHFGHRITSGEARITGAIPAYIVKPNGSLQIGGWYYLVYDENGPRLMVFVRSREAFFDKDLFDATPVEMRNYVLPLTYHKETSWYGGITINGVVDAMEESATGALSFLTTRKGDYLYDGERAFYIRDAHEESTEGYLSDCESQLTEDERADLPDVASVIYVPGIVGVELVDASETQSLPYESPETAGYYNSGK